MCCLMSGGGAIHWGHVWGGDGDCGCHRSVSEVRWGSDFRGPVAQIADPTGEWTAVSIGIEGMTCEACAVNLRNVLVNVPGVHDASVSYTDGSATIRFEASAAPSKTDLVSAVADAGYKADISAMNR